MSIDESFADAMRKGIGAVVIMAGSGSDEEHVGKIRDACIEYGLTVDVRVKSAHKQPAELEMMIDNYNDVGGTYVIIAVAGGSDALSGTASNLANAPVISCPPDAKKYDFMTNPSCVMNPPGSSNGYVPRPENAARMAAQFYSGSNPEIRRKLESERNRKRESLKVDDTRLRKSYDG